MKKIIENKRINLIIGQYLLKTLLIVFILIVSSVILQSILYSREYSYTVLTTYVEDAVNEANAVLHEMRKDDIGTLYQAIISEPGQLTDEWLMDIVKANPSMISELNIVDADGIIRNSSNPKNLGFDMKSSEYSSEFLCLLSGTDYFEHSFITASHDNASGMLYSGKAMDDGSGFIELGLSADKHYAQLEKEYAKVMRYRRIGLKGQTVLLNKDYVCIGSTGDTFVGRKLENASVLPDEEGEYKKAKAVFDDEECYWISVMDQGYYIIGIIPVSESRDFGLAIIILSVLIMIAVLVVMYISLRKNLNNLVVKPIAEIDEALVMITGGNLDEKVNVHNSLEFEKLSNGINHTVDRLKEMIEAADKLVEEELRMARVIQHTSLPGIFPPYPTRKDMGLYASMNAAKQVGGDFYDFYMVKENMLAVVVADVADKGIPAAMFMMKAKTVLKSYAVSGRAVDKVVSMTNEELAKDNANMFVTVWIGFINLKTGLVQYVHAGHTYPLVIRGNEVLQIKQKRNFVVGGKRDAVFLKQEYQLLPGDTLFLYTDGVTEAINKDNEEYKEERLKKKLLEITGSNGCDDGNELCRQVCTGVLEDVRSFSSGAEQFDDITMLCFKFQPDTQN